MIGTIAEVIEGKEFGRKGFLDSIKPAHKVISTRVFNPDRPLSIPLTPAYIPEPRGIIRLNVLVPIVVFVRYVPEILNTVVRGISVYMVNLSSWVHSVVPLPYKAVAEVPSIIDTDSNIAQYTKFIGRVSNPRSVRDADFPYELPLHYLKELLEPFLAWGYTTFHNVYYISKWNKLKPMYKS